MPVERISEADALAAHQAIHKGSACISVKLPSGKTLPIELNGSKHRVIKFAGGVTAAEQNKNKPSEWAAKAKKGMKITWFLTGSSPSLWGRIAAGKIETRGAAITEEAPADSSAADPKKRPAAAVEEGIKAPMGKKAKADAVAALAAAAGAPPSKKAKVEAAPSVAASSVASSSCPVLPPVAAVTSGSDPLGLSALFSGSGHGAVWEAILRPVIEGLTDAGNYIGPGRNKEIVPVRELTFQALKPNPPSGWRVVSFGQSPYPRIQSATGIAHFDNELRSWDEGRFGSIVTMRCLIKAAAMHKHKVTKDMTTPELRALLKSKGVVGPAEWFQAMLTQGVLFMNAACTLQPPQDKAERSGPLVDQHRRFWLPVVQAVVRAILQDCSENKRGVVFAWWGSESLKTKKCLKACFEDFPGAKVEHIDAPNPAAMGDIFCNEPNNLGRINDALKALRSAPIDWLPSAGWKTALPTTSRASLADEMGSFITETQDLHKMYLERLRDGLDISGDELADITGISTEALVTLADACRGLKLEKAAEASLSKVKGMKLDGLTLDEAAAIHLYTTNHLYKMLNEALRFADRTKAKQYFSYLRLLLVALDKIPRSTKMLYRGVALDLSAQYRLGTEVTWWAVSSCTPDLKVASQFSGGAKRTLFLINASRGVGIRNFSEFKSEEEFILSPGTSFSVAKVTTKGQLHEIHLKEIKKPRRVR